MVSLGVLLSASLLLASTTIIHVNGLQCHKERKFKGNLNPQERSEVEGTINEKLENNPRHKTSCTKENFCAAAAVLISLNGGGLPGEKWLKGNATDCFEEGCPQGGGCVRRQPQELKTKSAKIAVANSAADVSRHHGGKDIGILKRQQKKNEQKEKRKVCKIVKRGAKALLEIRKYQKSVDPIIPLRPFWRLVKEVAQDMHPFSDGGKRFEVSAVKALRETGEAFVVSLFEDAQAAAVHAKRITVMPKDVALVQKIKGVIQKYETRPEKPKATAEKTKETKKSKKPKDTTKKPRSRETDSNQEANQPKRSEPTNQEARETDSNS